MAFFPKYIQSTAYILKFCFIRAAFSESRLEGWLSIPNRANIKRYGWKKQVCCVLFGLSSAHLHCVEVCRGVLRMLQTPWGQYPSSSHCPLKYFQYVVVSSKKILFYNDEQDKEQSNPSMVLDIE